MTRDRRQFLRAVGGLSLGSLGACTGDSTSGPTETAPRPTADAGGDRAADTAPRDSGGRAADYSPPPVPPPGEIPENGTGENFELVGHTPLLDEHQYVGDEPLGIPRGSNGDITVAGDCVYVGSFTGNQPPLVVDVSTPADPQVVGPVPDAVPGVANGIEGVQASGGLLAIDHRSPHGETFAETPADLPARGLSVWDVSDSPREPDLVGRFDHGDLAVHALRLWRDPANPDRVLAVQSFIDTPNIRVLDLTGCRDGCDPTVVAEWSLEAQTGLGSTTHEAIMSTDGTRLYVAQPMEGFLKLDSSNLVESLRGGGDCDPAPPEDLPGDDHCLTVHDAGVESALAAQAPIRDGWHHTLQTVPDRPYMLALSESTGPDGVDADDPADYGSCPGGQIRVFSVEAAGDREGPGARMAEPGSLEPEPVGSYSLPEQRPANCGSEGWDPEAVAWPGWLSPHFSIAFPDLLIATYYSGGLRAVDISDPTEPTEVGHFFNDPVPEVRWATYGPPGDSESGEGGAEPSQRRDSAMSMFAFSYPVVHDGHVIYGDVHSGLYVLEYTGPHAEQIPEDGTCLAANPGGVEPGYEPCPPYGGTPD